jgi:hypothetical protein
MSVHSRVLWIVVLSVAFLGVMASSALATAIPIGPDGFTPPPIKVAIVHSKTTLDWLNYRGTPSRYPHGGKEAALLYYLQGRTYDVTEIVGDRDLLNSNNLKQYDVIVLPSMYGMGYPASESLARYVAAGGGLVATIGSPRVNPAYAPKRGVKDHLNEWWWRVMGSHYWEWGPLNAVYQEKFINDGSYTPEFTLKPNASSPIIQQTQTILAARGLNSNIAGITLHHPGANLEMSLPLSGSTDRQTAADFNILTPSVKKLYPKTYTAILGSRYGAGRSVKFDYGAITFLQNYSSSLYSPLTPTGVHQGEVGGALLEASIIWAASADGTVAHSADATTYADVVSKGKKVTANQRVTNRGNTITRLKVRFTLYSASGRTLKTWLKNNILFLPHQSRVYSYTYKHRLPSGRCKVVALATYGYPGIRATVRSESTLTRGHRVRTH